MNEEFKIESWDKVKSKDFDLLSSGDIKKHLFKKLGYGVLESGELFDLAKREKVQVVGRIDEFINLKESTQVALISGSHNFVRDVAEYSDFLAEKGGLKFIAKSSSKKE